MSIAEVKKFVESWIVDAKKDSVAVIDKPIQICGVTLPKEVVGILKAHYFVECEERANQILQMLEDVESSSVLENRESTAALVDGIAHADASSMPEPSASPDHEFVFGSVQSMRIRVWNETSRAVCIVDFDGVANPAGYISAFVAGLSPLGDIPEARREDKRDESKPEHEPDPVGSIKRYLADGG